MSAGVSRYGVSSRRSDMSSVSAVIVRISRSSVSVRPLQFTNDSSGSSLVFLGLQKTLLAFRLVSIRQLLYYPSSHFSGAGLTSSFPALFLIFHRYSQDMPLCVMITLEKNKLCNWGRSVHHRSTSLLSLFFFPSTILSLSSYRSLTFTLSLSLFFSLFHSFSLSRTLYHFILFLIHLQSSPPNPSLREKLLGEVRLSFNRKVRSC